MTKERRKDKRYCIEPDKVQAFFPDIRKTHPVKDISKGGVRIEYNPLLDGQLEPEKVDIIATDYDRVYLSKISCETVYDILALMQGRSFKGGAMRVCGLKFVNLTKEQEGGLSVLLKRCLNDSS
jgi:hypothetical protein